MSKYFIKQLGLFVCLFVCLFVGKANLLAANAFSSSGTGTKNDPYIVNTADQFKKLADLDSSYRDKYFGLGTDIDLKNQVIKPIANIRYFEGYGHIIKNFKINSLVPCSDAKGTFPCSGVFGVIKNLNQFGVENAIVEINNPAGGDDIRSFVGILCGNLASGNLHFCYVRNSILKINSAADAHSMTFGAVAGDINHDGWYGDVRAVYAVGCTVDLRNCAKVLNGTILIGNRAYASNFSVVADCFSSTKLLLGPSLKSGNFNTLINNWASGSPRNYYDKTVLGYSLKKGIALTTSQMVGLESDMLSKFTNGWYRLTKGYPVLNTDIFNTKINSIAFNNKMDSDDTDNFAFTYSKLSIPVKVKLNLSNTLNQQNQGDKICLYVDDGITPVAEITSGDEISIQPEKLNGLNVGQHSLKAKVFDCLGNALFNCDQELALTVKPIPNPTITGLIISPSKISKNDTNELKLTVLGDNLTSGYNISLKYTNKNTNFTDEIPCGPLQDSGSHPQVIDITDSVLSKIKSGEFAKGDYIFEAVITKVGEL